MDNLAQRFQIPIALGFLLAGSLFLLRLAYLPIWISTPTALALLIALRFFIDRCYAIKTPLVLLIVMLLAVEVDAIGNLFGWYNQRFGVIQYDEVSHCLISGLVLPVVVWGLRAALSHFGYRLPIGAVAFFAFATMFTLAGFYEVIELWDDKYLHPVPGWRIHGAYDTANDLQWDLLGMGTGAIISYIVLKVRKHRDDNLAM